MFLPSFTSRIFGRKLEDFPRSAHEAIHEAFAEASEALPDLQESTLIRTVGWVSAALGAVALGLFVGAELRQRYKFNRRTPYDFYAHSGDDFFRRRAPEDLQDLEFGVGI